MNTEARSRPDHKIKPIFKQRITRRVHGIIEQACSYMHPHLAMPHYRLPDIRIHPALPIVFDPLVPEADLRSRVHLKPNTKMPGGNVIIIN